MTFHNVKGVINPPNYTHTVLVMAKLGSFNIIFGLSVIYPGEYINDALLAFFYPLISSITDL